MKKLTKTGLTHNEFTNAWKRQQAELKAIALESVAAALEVVEAERAVKAAQERLNKALQRKQSADARLAVLRENLGAE